MIPIETEEADGSMNHCSDKSQLMTMLEKEVDQSLISKYVASNEQESDRVAIVDAIVVVQGLDKGKSVKTCQLLRYYHITDAT